jgi:hypothetical protein
MPGMFIFSMKKERFCHKPGCYYNNLTGQGMQRNAEVELFTKPSIIDSRKAISMP